MLSVWLHGWATDSRVFGPLIEPLAALPGLDILAPKLAHWLDPACPESWGPSLARRLEAETPSGRPLILCGWSMGAMLALEAARDLGGKVKGLLLFSGCARFISDSANPEGQYPRVLRLMQRRLSASPESVLRDFYGRMFTPDETEARASFQRDLEPEYLGQRPEWLSAGLGYLQLADIRQSLRDIHAPALVFHGLADRVTAPALGKFLGMSLPEARFVEFDNAGHLPFWPGHREIETLTGEFLTRIMGIRSVND